MIKNIIILITLLICENSIATVSDGEPATAAVLNSSFASREIDTDFAGVVTFINNTIYGSLTATTVPYLNASKQLTSSAVTPTELGYISGVTSAIQTQIDNKQALDADLTAISALTGTGIISRTGTSIYAERTITGTTNEINVSNGNGVAGNPTLSIVNDPVLPGTGAVTTPKGTTAQRPGTPIAGMLRYNTDTNEHEKYNGTIWESVGAGAGGGASSNNVLGCPDMECASISTEWTNATGTLTQETTSTLILFGSQSAKITLSAQTLDFKQNKTFLTAASQSYEAKCWIKSSSALIELCGLAANVEKDCVAYDGSDVKKEIISRFVSTSTGQVGVKVKTTGAETDDVYIDNCSVEPLNEKIASPVSNTISYTPAFNGWTASTTDIKYQKVGDKLHIQGQFDVSASSAVEARINLPTGYTVKSARSRHSVGMWWIHSASSGHGGNLIADADQGYVKFSQDTCIGSASIDCSLPVNANTITSTSIISVNLFVEVNELSSSTNFLTSNAKKVNPVKVTSSTTVTGVGPTIIIMPTEERDIDNLYNTGTGVYTAPKEGIYSIDGHFTFSTQTWGISHRSQAFAYVDGIQKEKLGTFTSQTTTSSGVDYYFGGKIYLLKGELLTIRILQDNGATVTLNGSAIDTWYSITHDSSDEFIAATLKDTVKTPGAIKPVLVSALVTDGASTTTVSEEDDNFILNNCSNASAGSYQCDFTVGYWTSKPHCWVQPNGGERINATIPSGTSNVVLSFLNSAGASTDVSFNLFCKGVKN